MSTLCNCTPNVPPLPLLDCIRQQKSAGADLLVFKLCSYQFNDVTDITEWQSALLSGNVILIPHAKITRSAPSITTATDASGGEYATGENYSITIEDADMPYDPNTTAPSVDSRKHPLWDSIKWKPGYYQVAWNHVDAPNSVYGFYKVNGSNVTEQSGETALESRKFMGDITFSTGGQFQPAPVALLDLRQLF